MEILPYKWGEGVLEFSEMGFTQNGATPLQTM